MTSSYGDGRSFQDLIDVGLLEIGDGYRANIEGLGGTGPIFLMKSRGPFMALSAAGGIRPVLQHGSAGGGGDAVDAGNIRRLTRAEARA
jgi:hypothetical protein